MGVECQGLFGGTNVLNSGLTASVQPLAARVRV